MNKQKLEVTKNPYILLPILLFLWGSLAAITKLILRSLDGYQVIFFMFGIAALVYTIVLIVKGGFAELVNWRIKDYLFILLCGIFSFLYDFLYIQSLEILPAIEASMLNYLFPIFIVLFAIPINHERLDFFKILSILFGFAGTVLLITKGNFGNMSLTNMKGDIMAISAAISWGLFTNLTKRNQKDLLLSNILIVYVAFLFSAISLITFSHFQIPTVTDFSRLVWLGVSNIVLGFLIYIRALKYTSASLVASFTYFTPFVTLFFIMIMVGEKLTLIDLLAFLLICVGVPIQGIGNRLIRRRKNQVLLRESSSDCTNDIRLK